MHELNEFWANSLEQAIEKARAGGRHDVADYLALKAANDALRAAASRWLFESFLEIAHEAIRRGINLRIENENPHRFEMNRATMVGSLVRFVFGIRSMTVETGWTRTPADGFMRGGALAAARLVHFGQPKHNSELVLLRSAKGEPEWFALNRDGSRTPFHTRDILEHFAVFIG